MRGGARSQTVSLNRVPVGGFELSVLVPPKTRTASKKSLSKPETLSLRPFFHVGIYQTILEITYDVIQRQISKVFVGRWGGAVSMMSYNVFRTGKGLKP